MIAQIIGWVVFGCLAFTSANICYGAYNSEDYSDDCFIGCLLLIAAAICFK